jgi:hypothetical protein
MQAAENAGNSSATASAAAGESNTGAAPPKSAGTAPVDTEVERASHGKLHRSDCVYLEWQLDQPILQNWGFSVSLLSCPAHHRRLKTSTLEKDSKRAGAAEPVVRMGTEDSMHSSTLPSPHVHGLCAQNSAQ